ncbi:hypothetical protein [Streptomyces rishiriensis]|uniref:Transcription elongation factor n=1 Tax=Streptomyces rishiriensis TaxID=68264 RepID=A0ABU0NLD4_STRRH|nr:hypothetical protein [Streptomyces rishiriensis]MDQ0579900.1 transcription elongation factor [Streptomyces rishiriensis]
MTAPETKGSGSSRNVSTPTPILDSRSRTSTPRAWDSAPKTVPRSTEAPTRTATPTIPPGCSAAPARPSGTMTAGWRAVTMPSWTTAPFISAARMAGVVGKRLRMPR